MSLSIPVRFADGAGNAPAAANWNDDYDWLTSVIFGLAFLNNGGMESWAAGTSFTNPSNATVLADSWTEVKSGTTPCTADVTREASITDSGTYSMKVNVTGAGSSDSYWAVKQSVGSPTAFGALTVVAGVKVKVATANKVRIKVYDGTTAAYSSYHTGDGTWQLLQAKLTCQAIPTEVTVTVEINPANFTDAVYMDSTYLYVVPSAISSRAQAALTFTPLGSAGSFLPLSGGTMTGNLTFSPTTKGVKGTPTNDSAAAGNVGEYVESVISANTNVPTSTQYGDLTSIVLTAGDWDVSMSGILNASGATISGFGSMGFSTTSGNSSTGLVFGDSVCVIFLTTTITQMSVALPPKRFSLGTTTTIYFKYQQTYSAGQPVAVGRISARRVR